MNVRDLSVHLAGRGRGREGRALLVLAGDAFGDVSKPVVCCYVRLHKSTTKIESCFLAEDECIFLRTWIFNNVILQLVGASAASTYTMRLAFVLSCAALSVAGSPVSSQVVIEDRRMEDEKINNKREK